MISATGRGYWLKENAEIALQHIADIEEKLFDHGLVGAKQLRILLVDFLHAGGVRTCPGRAWR